MKAIFVALVAVFLTVLYYSNPADAAMTFDVGNNSVAPVNNVLLNFSWTNSTPVGVFGNSYNSTANVTFNLPTGLSFIASSALTNMTAGLDNTSLSTSATVRFGNATTNNTIDRSGWFAFNISATAAGVYTVTVNETYILNTTGNLKFNNTIVLNINAATPVISITISPGNSTTYPNTITATASFTTGDSGANISLFRNGTLVNSSVSLSSVAQAIKLGAGTYNYTVLYNGTGNYSSLQVDNITVVSKGTPGLSISMSPAATVTSPTQTTVTGSGCPTDGAGDVTCSLSRSGSAVSNPETATLSAGTHAYLFSTSGGANWSSASASGTLTVNSPVVASSKVATTKPQVAVAANKVDVYVQKISPGTPATASVEKSDTGASEIQISVKNQVVSISVTINNIAQLPSDVQVPQGNVYKRWNVVKSGLDDANIDTATIKFSVEKSWLTANNIDPDKVTLQRYSGGQWQSLVASKLSEDSTFVHYSATTPGFSYFVISGQPLVTAPAQPPAQQPEQPPAQPTTPAEPAPTPKPYDQTLWVIVFVIVIVAVVALYMFKPSKKKK